MTKYITLPEYVVKRFCYSRQMGMPRQRDAIKRMLRENKDG